MTDANEPGYQETDIPPFKIGYKTIIEQPNWTRYEPIKGLVVACCQDMDKAWDSSVVFAQQDYGPAEPVVQIAHRYWSYGDMETDYFPINFCPFCGAHVECVEQQRVKVVEETVAEVVTQKKVVRREVPA